MKISNLRSNFQDSSVQGQKFKENYLENCFFYPFCFFVVFLTRFLTRFLARVLTGFLARVLTRVLRRGKTHNPYIQCTVLPGLRKKREKPLKKCQQTSKNLKAPKPMNPSKRHLKPFYKGLTPSFLDPAKS